MFLSVATQVGNGLWWEVWGRRERTEAISSPISIAGDRFMFRDRRAPRNFDRALGIENLTRRLKIPQLQVVGLKAVGRL